MENLVIFFYILLSVILILLILLQQGKGSDIGSAFGGGSGNTMFGPNSNLSPLTKITSILAAAFLILSLYISWQASSLDQIVTENPSEDIVEQGILPDTKSE